MSLNISKEISAVFDQQMTSLCNNLTCCRLLLAVSGGGDSMSLMHLAAEWAYRRGLTCSVITIDHKLRDASAKEAHFVKLRAQALGLNHQTVAWHCETGCGNLQMRARDARYRLIDEYRANHNVVLTGHTLDDQAETFLLRLRRGSGVDGLGGIPSKRKITSLTGEYWLVRPMLNFSRNKLRHYLQERNISWLDDPSNQDQRFDRTKIRNALQHFNKIGLSKSLLAKTANHMQRAKEVLDQQVKELAQQICTCQMGDILISLPGFSEVQTELQYRLFAKALRWVSSKIYNPKFAALVATLENVCDGKAQTLHGCYIVAKGREMRIAREPRAVLQENHPFCSGLIWDQRWKIDCLNSRSITVCHVAPLGRTGADWVRKRCDTVLPYKSIQSHPGVYDNTGLLSAPSLVKNKQFVATFCSLPFEGTLLAY